MLISVDSRTHVGLGIELAAVGRVGLLMDTRNACDIAAGPADRDAYLTFRCLHVRGADVLSCLVHYVAKSTSSRLCPSTVWRGILVGGACRYGRCMLRSSVARVSTRLVLTRAPTRTAPENRVHTGPTRSHSFEKSGCRWCTSEKRKEKVGWQSGSR
jgi:hypothetical protein